MQSIDILAVATEWEEKWQSLQISINSIKENIGEVIQMAQRALKTRIQWYQEQFWYKITNLLVKNDKGLNKSISLNENWEIEKWLDWKIII